MNNEQFVSYVRTQCAAHGVEFVIDETIIDKESNIEVNGYFCSDEMALKVSTKNTRWVETLVHEYCHLRQWENNSTIWTESEEVEDDFWEVLNGKPCQTGHREKVQTMEYDCEVRVMKLIDDFNLDIAKFMYCRRANAYIYFYHIIERTGKWYEIGNEPYNNEIILDHMPSVLDPDYKHVGSDILDMMEQVLFGTTTEKP